MQIIVGTAIVLFATLAIAPVLIEELNRSRKKKVAAVSARYARRMVGVIILAALVGCSRPATTPPATHDGQVQGTWSAYTIIAGDMEFRSAYGVRGVNVPVWVWDEAGCWYAGTNNWRMIITLVRTAL